VSAFGGLVVYQRDGALVARRLDLDREEMESEPFVILDRVGYVPSGLLVSFAASADGRVAVAKSVNAELAQLTLYARAANAGYRRDILPFPEDLKRRMA
jgi:hypothetical protein